MEGTIDVIAEQEVIRKIKAGEIKLFELLIRRYNSFLYKIGRAYKYNHQDTEDLMQESYISAFCNLNKFENRSTFKTWLTTIMLNQCYKKKHKLSFTNEIPTGKVQDENSKISFLEKSNKENSPVNNELKHILENAIHQIPEDYSIVFTLRELNGLSVLETAEALSLSESNVKVRLNRAKTMLQKEIKKLYSPQEIFEFNLVYCDVMVKRVMDGIKELKISEN